MIDNEELPIGFTMELAMHSDVLNRFSQLAESERETNIEGAHQVSSQDEKKNYVETIFAK